MRVRVYVDIGGTGAKADAFAMWPSQFIAKEIRTRDYYEAQGQPLATHIQWLHSKGYKPEVADIYLPHDGATNEKIIDASFESSFKAAGYAVTVIPNQGKGAAKQRVEAGRRVFNMVYFDEETTRMDAMRLAGITKRNPRMSAKYCLAPSMTGLRMARMLSA
jgi:phage terminase large subunit